jgi:hypothetical protein
MSIRAITAATVVLGGFGFSGAANAAFLDGKNIGVEYLFPDVTSVFATDSGIVGPGTDVSVLGIDFDFTDTTVTITDSSPGPNTPAAFNGYHIFDIDGTIDPFGAVLIDAATNMVGFDASLIAFNDEEIFINVQGLTYDAAGGPPIQIVLELVPGSVAAPAPMSLGLVVLGFEGVGLSRIRGRPERRP